MYHCTFEIMNMFISLLISTEIRLKSIHIEKGKLVIFHKYLTGISAQICECGYLHIMSYPGKGAGPQQKSVLGNLNHLIINASIRCINPNLCVLIRLCYINANH